MVMGWCPDAEIRKPLRCPLRRTLDSKGHSALDLHHHASIRASGEGTRQSGEAFERDVLGARGRLDSRAREQCQRVRAERLQALAQHLAALAERGLGHL